jgi:hypothetical protein
LLGVGVIGVGVPVAAGPVVDGGTDEDGTGVVDTVLEGGVDGRLVDGPGEMIVLGAGMLPLGAGLALPGP